MKGFGNGKCFGLRGGLCKLMVLLGLLPMSLALFAQTGNLPAPRSSEGINLAVLKLPVAHAHFGSWCMGILTIAPDAIRYDATRSHGKDEHSFLIKREQVLFLNYWMLAGQPMNAVEIRTATNIYHFWLMQSAAELQRPHSSWKPVEAAASDGLLLSLYYWRVTGTVPNFAAVNAALVRAKLHLGATLPTSQASASGNGAANDPYEKMSQHMYANTYSQSSTINQMNMINTMSHW